MRLTINLDDDLYAMARAHAVANKLSMSKSVGDLLRRRVSGGQPEGREPTEPLGIDPETLLPVVRARKEPITEEEIRRALENEDARYLEIAGRPPAPSES